MEKQRVCKICSKRFSNGKAMGGHMRSHLAKLPLPPKPPLNSEFSHSDLSLQDRESDTDSRPTKRSRSKRSAEPVSSVSESFSTEDVALCLLMMSRDRWKKNEKVKEVDFDYNSVDENEDDEEYEDEDSLITRINHRSRGKFKCKTCNKAFRSYQALGGHKASHKKINHVNGREEFVSGCKLAIHRRVFECPFCPKVFESGQALGGHKKVHLSHMTNVKNSSHAKFGQKSIDLNRPAPDYDDDEDEEVSQVEFSAISRPTKFVETHDR